MKKLLFGFLFALSFQFVTAQASSVTVEIKGIHNAKGNIVLGLYNSETGFAIYDKNYQKAILSPSTEGVTYTFENIPSGTYAVAVWHDENDNRKIDKNWFGVPTEYYGFSLNKYGTFGPPDFNEVSFEIISNQKKSLTITLK